MIPRKFLRKILGIIDIEERGLKRRGLVRLISILPAVGAIIALIQVVICFSPSKNGMKMMIINKVKKLMHNLLKEY